MAVVPVLDTFADAGGGALREYVAILLGARSISEYGKSGSWPADDDVIELAYGPVPDKNEPHPAKTTKTLTALKVLKNKR